MPCRQFIQTTQQIGKQVSFIQFDSVMKKVVVFPLIAGILLSPLLLRMSLPGLYQAIGQAFPNIGLAFMIVLDIGWLWIILFLFYVTTQFSWRKRLEE